MWENQFGSPVVGIHSTDGYGNLRTVPMTTVAQETLETITGSSALAIRMETACLDPSDAMLK